MADLTYSEAIDKINALESRGWRLGLDRMAAFCEHAGLAPYLGGQSGPSYVHIAGTNGKGSTTAFVESLIRAHGFKSGAFFSPFVTNYRERIQSAGRWIGEDDLAHGATRLFQAAESFADSEYGGITKFEFEAALGFQYWGEHRCDWVALEVGLGGRLDATNVVQPASTVVVSIGLDHVSILGDTIEKIAFEKAGIIKPGIPAVVGQMPASAAQVIEDVARDASSPVWRFGHEVVLEQTDDRFAVFAGGTKFDRLRPSLKGQMQPHNMALAIGSMVAAGWVLDASRVQAGVEGAYAPGRFERKSWAGATLVLDGAHNSDAARSLVLSLEVEYKDRRPWVLVTNTIGGHDADAFYAALGRNFENVLISPIDSPRAIEVRESCRIAERSLSGVEPAESLPQALNRAVRLAGRDGVVVVTGSNYLAGEALNFIACQESSAPR